MEINKDKIIKLVGILDETIRELKAVSRLPKEKILASRDRFAMENLFYRMAMASIDICFHIVSKKSGNVPGTYRECFTELVTLGLLDPDIAEKMDALAGLRNIIAHAYSSMDYDLHYDFLNELDKVEIFRNRMLSMVRT